MNLSGNAVRYWMQAEKIPLENVLVIVDDLALPVGALRLKGQGSDGGHNGLKHIAATLGTTAYARLRFGIGNDFGKGHQVNFVLGAFDVCSIESSSFVAAGFGTLVHTRLPGFIGPFPPPLLIRLY